MRQPQDRPQDRNGRRDSAPGRSPAPARSPASARSTRVAAWLPAIGLAALAGACTSGLEGPAPLVNSNVPMGIDLGFADGETLTSPTSGEWALTAARIRGRTGEADREIAFLAFATTSAADSASTAGDPLVRDDDPPQDGNGVLDVFLVAVESLDVATSHGALPSTFRQGLLNVVRHDRCWHCHAVGHVTPGGGVAPFDPGQHPGGDRPLVNDGNGDGTIDCLECHISPAHTGTDIVWFAPQPIPDALAPAITFDIRTRSVTELNELLLNDPTGNSHGGGPVHLKNSPNIDWAITSGRVPDVNDPSNPAVPGVPGGTSAVTNGLDIGPVPVTKARFEGLVDAWAAKGFRVDAKSAIGDVALVSQLELLSGLRTSGDGASFDPAITFVPNPAFEPGAPTEQPAGFVHVAFTTLATDLVSVLPGAPSQVVRATVAVWMDRNPGGAPGLEFGSLDLEPRPDLTVLVSRKSGVPTQGGNDESRNPSVSADGDFVAFESRATDLLTGVMGNNNGAGHDVFVRAVDLDATALVSAAAGPLQGGNGLSIGASISPDASAVAFETDATNLVAGDTNARRDIVYARVDTATGALAGGLVRASVLTGGAQGTGGNSRSASVVVLASGEVLVAFESDKTNLVVVPPGSVLPATSVYLFQDTGPVTTLGSKRLRGVGDTVIGNLSSTRPRLGPDGTRLAYETLANNLEAVLEVDAAAGVEEYTNHLDVILADLTLFLDTGVPDFDNRRISVDVFGRGGRAHPFFVAAGVTGDSGTAQVASFRRQDGLFSGTVVAFSTDADNLGKSENTDEVVVFERE